MAGSPRRSLELFISYSHRDEPFRDELIKHLKPLEYQGIITAWHDRRIGAGEDWRGRIDHHLDSAHIILLLISSDFLASEYCYSKENETCPGAPRNRSGSRYSGDSKVGGLARSSICQLAGTTY